MARGSRFVPIASFVLAACASRAAPVPAPVVPARTFAATPDPSTLARVAPNMAPPAPAAVAQPEANSDPNQPSASENTIALDVPDFSPAVVRFPDGAGRAPVLLVTHGAGGTPETHCELWARISRGKAILLCVRGRARSPLPADGAYYPDHPALERETFAALAALRARVPERIASGPVFYAGFSQGATMGALMLVEHASEVTRLVLVEGGFSDWNVARARDFRARGGERVLFVCGRKECAEPARNAARWFKDAGVAAQVEYVRGAGHSHDARVEAHLAALYPWFTEGDARWQSDPAAP
jgi:predicted esterase